MARDAGQLAAPDFKFANQDKKLLLQTAALFFIFESLSFIRKRIVAVVAVELVGNRLPVRAVDKRVGSYVCPHAYPWSCAGYP